MRRLEQTRILHPSELLGEVEAEAEGSRDVKEVQRNPGLLVQPCAENPLEEVQSVRGTCLEEINWSSKQPPLGRIRNHL